MGAETARKKRVPNTLEWKSRRAMSDAMAPGAPSRTRLMITKMVLENFKSYGGVREVPLARAALWEGAAE
jgi:hypothetical protein